MAPTLLLADEIVTMNARFEVFKPGYILIEDGVIREVGRIPAERLQSEEGDERIPPTPLYKGGWGDSYLRIELKNRLVMPGLVNAHTHSPMTLFRGMVEPYSLFTFEGWYQGIRTLEAVMDGDMVPPAVAVSCAEMIRTGTTCFADQYFYMDKIVPVVEESGLRAALAYGIVEMGDEAAREREIGAARAFLGSVRGHPRIKGWVGPHAFFVDNSPEAMRLELALADEFETGLHFHLATSGEEERYCREHYGVSAVEQMRRLGVLQRRLLAAHSITVPEEDFETLARHLFTAVVAPSACMRSGAEIAALKAMQQAGVNTALGTDNVANNNSYDLFKEMQLTGKLMSLRERQPAAIPARTIVEMATLGGARALGLEAQIGSLEPGKQADLISLDLDEIGWSPRGGQDVYTALVYSISGLHVRDVMVGGDWLLRAGKFTTIDYPVACAELDAAQAELANRAARLEAHA
jgi:5-methylthioadenosine/S-adenosylhomocysteine deaminase